MLFWLLMLTAMFFRSSDSSYSCFFCADFSTECDENVASENPVRMICERFRLNNEDSPQDHLAQPQLFRKFDLSYIFAVSLKDANTKTLCMRLRYRYANGTGYWMDSKQNKVIKINDSHQFTFQTCMYEQLQDYKNVCEYFTTEVFPPDIFTTDECIVCKTQNCNSAKMVNFRVLSLLVTALVLANLIYF